MIPLPLALVVVTYAPDAKVPRGAHDPVLPKGTRPCAAYPERGDGVPRYSEAMTPPQRVRYTHADFSRLPAEERNVQGILFAEVTITAKGRVSRVHILRSLSPAFDKLIVEEWQSSVYRPARLDGRNMPVCMVYTVRPHVR